MELIASKERLDIYKAFQNKVTSFKFKIFLLKELPSAFFSGVRVKSLNNTTCVTTVPFKWFSQNPFHSTYFACQAMAAELSTGLPAIMAIENRNPRISMLVVDMEATFTKKAVAITSFYCEDVTTIVNAVEKAIATKEGQTVKAKVVGKDDDGNEISTFSFTWSFKETKKRIKN